MSSIKTLQKRFVFNGSYVLACTAFLMYDTLVRSRYEMCPLVQILY